MTDIALIDYGAGNLRSVAKAFEAVGARVTVVDEPGALLRAERVVLPGVGAFGDGMAELGRRGLVEPLLEVAARGRPLLGVCLGMQLLLDSSEEMGDHDGLGLLPGRVVSFDPAVGKVPHTGWNQIQPESSSPLLAGLEAGCYAYFNHGYYCQVDSETTAASTTYGAAFASVIQQDHVYGVQFHPEKSQHVGLQVLTNFLERV